MARQFLAAIALAHHAAALLDGYVDVVVKVDVHVAADLLAGAVGATASADGGFDACATATAVVRSCYNAGLIGAGTPPRSAEACLCCDAGTAISSAYSSCSSYVSSLAPDESTVYTAASRLWSICSAAGGGICAAGAGGGGPIRPTTGVTIEPAETLPAPAACTSLVSIYRSCSSSMRGFATARLGDVAKCFCHDQSGKFNTRFEDYASSCLPFVRTAVPRDYRAISVFQTLCDALQHTASGLSFSAISSGSAGGSDIPEFRLTSATATSSPTSSPTADASSTSATTSAVASATTSSSTALAAPQAAVPGIFAWIANLATFILSFFILI